jgi:SAM-dependent methyltransferase
MIQSSFLSILISTAGALVASRALPQPERQPPPPSTAPAPASEGHQVPVEHPRAIPALQAEADLLKPLMTSDLACDFLAAVPRLPEPGPRILVRHKEKPPLSLAAFEELDEAGREGYVKREFPPRFFYYTGYGSPLVFARPLDILAGADKDNWTPDKLPSKHIIDFGCGTIGHLRLLASLGADVTGIDVEPILDALYAAPGDQGEVEAPGGRKGHVRLFTGQWPSDEGVARQVRERAPQGYDLFISKNTLKRGYIHPARAADPSRLVHLGVTDEVFLTSVHDTLKPGGVFLIYNLSPARAPADKPYIPHADGECPFTREQLVTAGFEIAAFDEDDQDAIVKYWLALGYNQGKDAEAMKKELFAWWTMCRKPAG